MKQAAYQRRLAVCFLVQCSIKFCSSRITRTDKVSQSNSADAKSLEVTTPQQLKGNREDACLLLGTISPLANITRSDNAPTTERQSRRRLSVRVALIEDEAVPRTDKPSLEDAFVPLPAAGKEK
jgi:hypothetical protein